MNISKTNKQHAIQLLEKNADKYYKFQAFNELVDAVAT